MDDIADILASVSGGPLIPQATLDLQALTRAWVNERTAPELLPYPADLVDRTMERVARQVRCTSLAEVRRLVLIVILKIEAIETMNATADPSANFRLVIVQTELERFKFLVRSLLRARMAKVRITATSIPECYADTIVQIDTYPLHSLALSQASPTALSQLERQYLDHHQYLLSSHYNTAFLSSFPAGLRKLDDTAGGISMIDKPDEDNAVFCRILRDAGQVEVQGEQGAGTVELNRGDVWVLRWRNVKEGVERGDIELI